MKIKEIYDYGRKNLPESSESSIFCEEFFSLSRTDIILRPDTEIDNFEIFFDAVERRKNGEPLQYIIGKWEFDEMELLVGEGVLVPREDTLVLVDNATNFISKISSKNNIFGVDLCSGTGAVALAVANRFENVKMDAIELYEKPYGFLCKNIENYGNGKVTAKKLDVFLSHNLYSELDFIVSNPPYIESREIETLQIEVQNEPHGALDGGADGLDFYKAICQSWSKSLKIGGLLAVEIGETQGEDVMNLFKENGFKNVELTNDFNGLARVVSGIREC